MSRRLASRTPEQLYHYAMSKLNNGRCEVLTAAARLRELGFEMAADQAEQGADLVRQAGFAIRSERARRKHSWQDCKQVVVDLDGGGTKQEPPS